MVHRIRNGIRLLTIAAGAGLLLWPQSGLARERPLCGPDFGVWFTQQRSSAGANELVVMDLNPASPFVRFGLRVGDRIVSLNQRPVANETRFAESFLVAGDTPLALVIARQGQEYLLHLKASGVIAGMVLSDPLYEAGFLLDERHPASPLVSRVFSLTPAYYAGLRQGDVIQSINGQAASVASLMPALKRGTRLNLIVDRHGQTRELTLLPPPGDKRRPARAIAIDGLSRAVGAPPYVPPVSAPANFGPLPQIIIPPPTPSILPPAGTVINPPRL